MFTYLLVKKLAEREYRALVYDILPLEEGAGKRCSECVVDQRHYTTETAPSAVHSSIAFRHFPPRKDVVNQCLEFASAVHLLPFHKLQALVYDILPTARKRCSEYAPITQPQSSGLAGGLVEQASWKVARRYDVGWPVQQGKAVQLNTAEVATRSVACVAEWVLR